MPPPSPPSPRPPPKPMGAKKLQKMIQLTSDVEANGEAKGAAEEGRLYAAHGPSAIASNTDLATQAARPEPAQASPKHESTPLNGIRCVLCQLDGTVAGISKQTIYVSTIELDQHLRSAFHSDEARLRRAEKIGEEKAMAKEDSK